MKKILYSFMILSAGMLVFPKSADARLEQARYALEDEYCVNDDCSITSSGGGGGGTTYSSSGGTSTNNTCATVMMTSDGTFSSSSACNDICSVACKTCTSNGVTKYYCAPPTGGTQHQVIDDPVLLDDPIDLSSCTLLNCAKCSVNVKGLKTCTKCNAGYVPSSGTCSACAAGTYSTDGLTCTQCPAGKYSAVGAASCTSCPAGKYSAAGASSCTACDSTMWSGTGASSCAPCAMFSEFSVGGYGECKTCSASGCTSATCNSGYTWDSSSKTCKSSGCPAGYFMPSAGNCQICPKGPYCPGGTATTTTDCPPGTATQTTGAKSASECVAPSTCPSGTTLYTSYPSNMCATTLECMDSGTKKYYCNGCKDGYTWVTGPNGCSPMSCPSGKTLSTSKPSNCSNYGACVSSGSVKYYCNSCNSGYTLDVTQGCVPTVNCAADFPIPNGTCTACGDTECSKATCESSDLVFAGQIDWSEGCICKTSGYVYNKSTKKCEAPSGSVDMGNCPSEVATYTSCPSECASCNKCTSNGSTKYMCTSCISGYILNSCGAGKASMCTPQNCGYGKYLEGSSCTGSCKTCPAGYYCNGTTKTICPAGKYSSGSAAECTTCQAGSTSLTEGGTSSSSCDMCMRLFPLDHLGMCTACDPSGCTAGLCQGEEGTEWSSSAHNCVVAGCPKGSRMVGGSCEACPSMTYQPLADYTGTTCTACPAANYSVSWQGTGASACFPCKDDHGTVVECRVSGTTVFNNAVNCNPGYAYYFTYGEGKCMQCGPGSYSAGGTGYYDTKSGNYGKSYSDGPMGLTCPNVCPKGTYNPLYGQTSSSACVKCPAGTYGAETGLAKCETCPAGTSSKEGATECVQCSKLFSVPNGSCMSCEPTGCTEISCNSGYTVVEGVCVNNSKLCAINFSIPNGICEECGDTECSKATCNSPDLVFAGQIDWQLGCQCKQSGYVYNKVSGKCEPSECEPGYYISGGVCTKCEAGYACDGKTKTQCPAGTASNGEGARECSFCSASGTYSPAGSKVCLACGPGKMDVSHTGCVECGEGTMCPTSCAEGQACIENTYQALCVAGTYSKAGASTCSVCGYGYYCPDGRASTRKKCGANTYTKTDQSTSEADCLKPNTIEIDHGTCTAVSVEGKCETATCDDGGYVWNPTTRQCDMGCTFDNGSCAQFDSATCTCKRVGACNSGYVADTDPTTSGSYICRKSCDEGMYIDPTKLNCTKEETQTTCLGSSSCEVCPAGYSCAGGKADKVECAAGKYSKENSKECSACTDIVLYDEDMNVSGSCTSCSKAYGYCEVTNCNSNTHPVLTGAGTNDFTCYKCSETDISSDLMTTIENAATKTGTYSVGGEAMRSDKNADVQPMCSSCIMNVQIENGYCLNCSYVGDKAVCNSMIDGAVLCNPGYQLSASGTCEACPSGTFKEGYNANQCTFCSDYIRDNSISYSDITTTDNIAATEAQVATANRISGGYITRVKNGSIYVSVGATSFSQCRLNADALDLVTCKEPLQRSENSCCCVKP